ncbi:MAG TPA: Rrf2 family transcriptional regulator [Dehalococcoidia bacterium]|nr:Rrf2 family transcriptional regulator [Dehalococcoidia bacterium]
MKVSTKGDYGVRALIELALHYGQGPLQSAEIAARQRIPEPYLDHLLTTLRRAGFIRSIRGPQGGHELVREPERLPIDEVIEALEGSLIPSPCLDEGSPCARQGGCAQREMWQEVYDATRQILHRTTLADLASRERQPAGGRYYI